MEALVTTKLKSPLCIALDTTDLARARTLAREVADAVGMVKLGMEGIAGNRLNYRPTP